MIITECGRCVHFAICRKVSSQSVVFMKPFPKMAALLQQSRDTANNLASGLRHNYRKLIAIDSTSNEKSNLTKVAKSRD
jgi:hypothetical protein